MLGIIALLKIHNIVKLNIQSWTRFSHEAE